MYFPKIYVLLLGFLFCISSHAQQYHFRNFTVANGLGSSSINHIFLDSKGYIWLATQGGGASRFNGKEFKNFTKAEGLICNDVTFITEDMRGNIWIGTAEGASVFDGTKFTNYNQVNGLTNSVVYCIYADANEKIWFATQDAGIKKFDGTKFDSIAGLSTNETYTIIQNKKGRFSFGTSNGICFYENGRVIDYYAKRSADFKTFFSSFIDKNDNTWLGSTTGDVIILSPNNQINELQLPAEVAHDFIGSITQDQKGNMWFGTDHGLMKYNGKEFKLFSEREGLSANTVQAVLCDYENNIWAGTLNGGANLLSSEAFVHYTAQEGLTSPNITAVCHRKKNNTYYIGTGNGLYIFNPSSKNLFIKVTEVKAIDKINITSLVIDSKGMLWLSAQEGIFVLEESNNALQLKKEYHEIAGERIVSPLKIIHDSKENTWVATYGSGIFLLNGKTEKNFSTKNNFASDKILTAFEDSKKKIWFGTQDAGAIKYDGLNFSPLNINTSKGELAVPTPSGKGAQSVDEVSSVWSITEDENANLFFGTGEKGIYRYNGKTISTYSINNGLSANFITSLQWSPKENALWAGSEKGLDKIEFTAAGQIQRVHTYKEQDGFKSAGINQNAILLTQSRTLWLGTMNGFWLFNAENDVTKNTSPKIQLTSIRLSYQKVDWKKLADSIDSRTNLPQNLKLAHNKNHLTFDIQALTTNDIFYTHILEGQDEQWSAPTKNNEITYSNINPGKYIFRAKAVNNEGKISDEAIAYSFTINPPWWSTWWFRTIAFFVIFFSLLAFIQARERVLKEQNVKLEATVHQRTLEISHQKELVEKTLTEKEGLLHEKEILLKEIHHRVKNNLQTISSMLMLQSAGLKDEQAKKAIAESQSRVRSIALVHQKLYQTDGLEKVELNAFIKDLTVQIQSLYRQKSKQVSINWEIPETHLLIDTAIPLGLILNELFTNSFKYAFNETGNGEIKILLNNMMNDETQPKAKSKKVKLSFIDSGPGLSSGQSLESASTLGLRLIKLLSQQIGATLNYSNEKGSEFTFIFSILELSS